MKTLSGMPAKKITFRHPTAGKRWKFIASRILIKKRQIRQMLRIMFCGCLHSKRFYYHMIVNEAVGTIRYRPEILIMISCKKCEAYFAKIVKLHGQLNMHNLLSSGTLQSANTRNGGKHFAGLNDLSIFNNAGLLPTIIQKQRCALTQDLQFET